jgi:Histone-like Protein p6
MRKFMTKEVTTTTLKLAKMKMVDGRPVAEPLEDEILLGNVSLERAQKFAIKKHGSGVTVFEAVANTHVYEMPVEEFIKVASIKQQ